MDIQSQTENVKKHQLPFNALLFAGLGLIAVAMVVIITASWQFFSPSGRIAATLIPLILLYFVGIRTRKSGGNFGHYLLVAATALLPFVTGAVLYQAGFGAVQDPSFLLVVGLITLSASLVLEVIYGETLLTTVTVISLVVVPQFAAQVFSPSQSVDYPLAALVSSLLLVLTASNVQEKERSNAYVTIGMLTGAYCLLFFPALLFSSEPFGLAAITVYIVEGVASFLLAVVCSASYLKEHKPYLLVIRRTFEQLSPLLLIGPLTIASISHLREPIYALILVVLSVFLVLASVSVPVASIKVSGYGGLIMGLIFLLLLVSGALQASWPIILLAIGFLFIAVAYFLQHRTEMRVSSPYYFGRWDQALKAMGASERIETVGGGTYLLGSKTPVHRSNDSLILIIAILVIAGIFTLFSQYADTPGGMNGYHNGTMMN